jgi:pSer/pThr/pTyr-binding forkhead associated (FHA) protein
MVQLKILSGKKAGAAWGARRFPVRIGRAASADLQLEENGVWDEHCRLEFDPAEGVVLRARPEAPARVNGQPVEQAVLRNGDSIELGSLQLQFWLSEIKQRGFRLREALTWLGLAAITLGQLALIYWLVNA